MNSQDLFLDVFIFDSEYGRKNNIEVEKKESPGERQVQLIDFFS